MSYLPARVGDLATGLTDYWKKKDSVTNASHMSNITTTLGFDVRNIPFKLMISLILPSFSSDCTTY